MVIQEGPKGPVDFDSLDVKTTPQGPTGSIKDDVTMHTAGRLKEDLKPTERFGFLFDEISKMPCPAYYTQGGLKIRFETETSKDGSKTIRILGDIVGTKDDYKNVTTSIEDEKNLFDTPLVLTLGSDGWHHSDYNENRSDENINKQGTFEGDVIDKILSLIDIYVKRCNDYHENMSKNQLYIDYKNLFDALPNDGEYKVIEGNYCYKKDIQPHTSYNYIFFSFGNVGVHFYYDFLEGKFSLERHELNEEEVREVFKIVQKIINWDYNVSINDLPYSYKSIQEEHATYIEYNDMEPMP